MNIVQTLKEDLLKNLLRLKREGYCGFFLMQFTHKTGFWIWKQEKTSVEIVGQKMGGKGSARLVMPFTISERFIKDGFVKAAEEIIKFVNK